MMASLSFIWCIHMVNWFRNGHITEILTILSLVPYPEIRAWYPEIRVWFPEAKVPYPEIRVWYPENRVWYPEIRVWYHTLKSGYG